MEFFFTYGAILQLLAILHFLRRRPDTYWIFIIIFGGALGALIYLVLEAVPDRQLFADSFQFFGRRKRISELENAIALNPSAANYEELGGLYLDDGKYARAKDCFDKAISSRPDSPDPFYRRGICAVMLGDYAAAVADLERVVRAQPKYDLHRPAGLLAHAYGKVGQAEKADALFPGSHLGLHVLGDAIQLRRVPGQSESPCRGARVGAAPVGQEARHARIPAAPRPPLVPPRQGPARPTPGHLAS